MAKHHDLNLQFAVPGGTAGPDHAAEQGVEESEQHEAAMLQRRWSGAANRRLRTLQAKRSPCRALKRSATARFLLSTLVRARRLRKHLSGVSLPTT